MDLKPMLQKNLRDDQFKLLKNRLRDALAFGHGADLTKLARIYNTDKCRGHNYTPHYQTHFQQYKNQKIRLLEIGVGGYDNPKEGGNSLRMWKKYFPKGQIYAIDLYNKSFLEEKRIKIFQGSQVDEDFLKEVVKQTGPLDLIIDDGSHLNEHVIKSFRFLFPYLKEGGIYVVEDTQTSYWPEFGGDNQNLSHSPTLMNYFKGLTDGLNHQEFFKEDFTPGYFDKKIVSIHFYHNLIFIYKGDNSEQSNFKAEDLVWPDKQQLNQ